MNRLSCAYDFPLGTLFYVFNSLALFKSYMHSGINFFVIVVHSRSFLFITGSAGAQVYESSNLHLLSA